MNDSTYETVDLSRYDEDYRKAKQADAPAPYRPVPDGRYQVIVETVELTKTRTTGNPMLKWRLRISGPTMADRVLWRNSVITERTIPYIHKDLALCGLHMDSFNELSSRLPELVSLRLEVTKRTKDNYEDIFFDRNLSAGPAANAAAASATSHSQPQSQPYDAAERSVHYEEELNDDLPF